MGAYRSVKDDDHLFLDIPILFCCLQSDIYIYRSDKVNDRDFFL